MTKSEFKKYLFSMEEDEPKEEEKKEEDNADEAKDKAEGEAQQEANKEAPKAEDQKEEGATEADAPEAPAEETEEKPAEEKPSDKELEAKAPEPAPAANPESESAPAPDGSQQPEVKFKGKDFKDMVSEMGDEPKQPAAAQSPTIVISSFPCSGASTWAANNEWVKDLESALYSRKPDGTPSDEFPNNYIQAIKWQLTNCNWKYLNVSSHRVVREALKAAGIKFYIFYPALERKENIIKLCQDRGDDAQFIQLLQENYENWVNEISQEENAYPLGENEFLSDALFETKYKFLKQ